MKICCIFALNFVFNFLEFKYLRIVGMPLNLSILKFSGSIGNRTYFFRNGLNFYKRKSSLNGARMHVDPAFKNTLEAAMFFGGCSLIGYTIKRCLKEVAPFVDISELPQRVIPLLMRQYRASEIRRKGYISMKDSDKVLNGLRLKDVDGFSATVLSKSYSCFSKERKKSYTEVAGYRKPLTLNKGCGASHYRISSLLFTVSDYYCNGDGKYVSVCGELNGVWSRSDSDYIPVDGNKMGRVVLTNSVDYEGDLPDGVKVLQVLVIEYFQKVGDRFEFLKTNSTATFVELKAMDLEGYDDYSVMRFVREEMKKIRRGLKVEGVVVLDSG